MKHLISFHRKIGGHHRHAAPGDPLVSAFKKLSQVLFTLNGMPPVMNRLA